MNPLALSKNTTKFFHSQLSLSLSLSLFLYPCAVNLDYCFSTYENRSRLFAGLVVIVTIEKPTGFLNLQIKSRLANLWPSSKIQRWGIWHSCRHRLHLVFKIEFWRSREFVLLPLMFVDAKGKNLCFWVKR